MMGSRAGGGLVLLPGGAVMGSRAGGGRWRWGTLQRRLSQQISPLRGV